MCFKLQCLRIQENFRNYAAIMMRREVWLGATCSLSVHEYID